MADQSKTADTRCSPIAASLLFVTFAAAHLVTPTSAYSEVPILPQAMVDVSMPQLTTVVTVAPGELQAAIDRAQPGDTLLLGAGAVYQGPITLPAKSGTGWITIGTRGTMLLPGVRVSPADALGMAKIAGGVGSIPAINTAPGAHHYRFIGIEFAPARGQPFNTGLVRLGTGSETTLADLPHHVIFDRCYIHGDAIAGGKRGIAANGAFIAVIESYLSNWHAAGYDTQAFASWGGPGPFLLRNSYFEASGENVMFGGADARIANLVPSDITITGNDFAKPLAWRGAANATVKNLFELKNARRVLIEQNNFSYNWGDAQTGTAINLKSANQDGTNPWAITEHVTFTNNRVSHAGGGIVLSTQMDSPAQPLAHILIRGNNFVNISSVAWGGSGQFLMMLGPVNDVTVDLNWVDQDGSILVADGTAMLGLVFLNNVVRHNRYGVKGSGSATGTASLNRFFPGNVFTGNNLIGGAAFSGDYPTGNTFDAAMPPEPPITSKARTLTDLRIVPSIMSSQKQQRD